MPTMPTTLLQLEKPGTPTLWIVKGDSAQFVFTYMVESGKITPSGSVNGSNTGFTLPSAPVAGTFAIYKNGVLQELGRDYTRSGTTVTFATAPYVGAILVAEYKILINLTGMTSTWDLRVSPTSVPVLSGTGVVGGANGAITVSLLPAQTATLTPTGTGSNSNTFVGTLTLKLADTDANVKTLEKAQTNLVL